MPSTMWAPDSAIIVTAALRMAEIIDAMIEESITRGPVYGWFTEGSDTPDLIEANALLDNLR